MSVKWQPDDTAFLVAAAAAWCVGADGATDRPTEKSTTLVIQIRHRMSDSYALHKSRREYPKKNRTAE